MSSIPSALLSGVSTLAGLLVGLGKAGFEATKKAADLAETYSKIGVVFGSFKGIVTSTTDELASKFGIVKQVSLDAAANIGLIAKASGMSEEEAAKLASSFTVLAADASSFFNVPMDVALEKIRAGLVGESEPIRSFGVLLSEAAVQSEGLALGLVKGTEKLNDQQKVVARASLITKGLADAQGDLERTADSESNQMKKLSGSFENFQTEVGAELIPSLIQAVALANDLGKAFSETFGIGPIQAFGEALQSVLATMRMVADNPLQTLGVEPAELASVSGLGSALGRQVGGTLFGQAA